ncbi:UDP-glucose 4-epimerase family protein [Vibrio sp. WXL103]|uniref:UDP-glucose 4-epimerase family protein n=1 Tax=Vibrio sp. WXL103 TaxID=3450710 RepID=UPI003EC6D4C2
MKILLTGASGFIGRKLIERLDKSIVRALGRTSPSELSSSQFFEHELNGSSDYSEALSKVDVVIHLGARVHVMQDSLDNPLALYREVNTAGTINLAKQAALAGVRRFIFISTIKVNGESSIVGKPFKESDPHAFNDDYGQSKSEAEKQLVALGESTGLEVVIIRPTLVYGAGVKANFASLMNLVNRGIPLPFGNISNNKRSLVSVSNLVDLIATCIDHPNAANQVFLVSDDNDLSTSEMVDYMAASLGKSNFQIPIPQFALKLVGKLLGKSDVIDRLLGSLQVDITHTKKTLGWEPPQKLEDGFKEAASAFINSNEK